MLSLLTMLLLQGQLFTLRLSQNGSFPRPLKGTEEEEYIRRAAAGELEARNKLVEHNLRLVAHIAKKYYSQTGDTDDLISIGTIGLIKAVNTYQPGRKIKLGTYAARCIENAILSPRRFQRFPVNGAGRAILDYPASLGLGRSILRTDCEMKKRYFCSVQDRVIMV